jgi:Arm DNA-binding domain
MRILLTDRALKAAKPGQMVWDSAVPGFGVRGKTFIVMRRMPGQKNPVRRSLGPYPIMTLAEAREAALEALRDIAKGVDGS